MQLEAQGIITVSERCRWARMESQMLFNQGLAQFYLSHRKVALVCLCASMLTLASCAGGNRNGDAAGGTAVASPPAEADSDSELTATDVAAATGEHDHGEHDHPVLGVEAHDAVGPTGTVGEAVDGGEEPAVEVCHEGIAFLFYDTCRSNGDVTCRFEALRVASRR